MEKLGKMYYDSLESLDFAGLSKFFLEHSIISYIIGILLIVVVFKLLKFPLKILKKIIVNSIIGYMILKLLLFHLPIWATF